MYKIQKIPPRITNALGIPASAKTKDAHKVARVMLYRLRAGAHPDCRNDTGMIELEEEIGRDDEVFRLENGDCLTMREARQMLNYARRNPTLKSMVLRNPLTRAEIDEAALAEFVEGSVGSNASPAPVNTNSAPMTIEEFAEATNAAAEDAQARGATLEESNRAVRETAYSLLRANPHLLQEPELQEEFEDFGFEDFGFDFSAWPFGAGKVSNKIVINKDDPIGSEKHPYKLSLPESVRQKTLIHVVKKWSNEKNISIRNSALKLKKKIGAIRVLLRNKRHDLVSNATKDMRFLDKNYIHKDSKISHTNDLK